MQPVQGNVILEIITQAMVRKLRIESTIPGFVYSQGNMLQGEPDRGIVYAIDPTIQDPEYQIGDVVIFKTKEIFQGFEHDSKRLIGVQHNEIIAKVVGT